MVAGQDLRIVRRQLTGVETGNRKSLAMLVCLMAVAQLDRQILSISLEPIGQEFQLSDTQLGLLSGLIFGVVFVLCGFPVARMAAVGDRRKIISVAAAFWSIATMLTAGAQSFAHLIIARMGVAAGESGSVAPAHSVISDLYPEDKRTGAMAIFAAGNNLGVLLAFLIGGVVGQLYGWRTAFICAGIPGLLLAALIWRHGPSPKRAAGPEPTGSLFLATFRAIWSHPGLRNALLGMAATGIVTFGALAWTPAFIIRTHGLSQAQTGLFLAMTIGVIGCAGTVFSGLLANRLGLRRPEMRIGVVIAAILISKPMVLTFLLAPSIAVSLMAFVGTAALAAVFWGPTFAYVHAQLPPQQRPMATAIFLFFFNMVGLGAGPTLVGIGSDAMTGAVGDASLGYALSLSHLAGLWGAWRYWRVMRHIKTAGYSVSA